MTEKKKMTYLTALVAALAVTVVVLTVILLLFHVVDFKLYRKNSEVLDLTDKEISVSHYEKLRAAMPDCEIHWDVPFQGGTLPENTREVTVTELTEADAAALLHLTELEVIHAKECRNYSLLRYLHDALPQVKVEYHVLIDGVYYDQDSTVVKFTSAEENQILSLQYLPKLTQAVACGKGKQTDFALLRNYCSNTGLDFGIEIGGQVYTGATEELTLEGIAEEEVYLLDYLEGWNKLHLVKPEATGETLLALRERYPKADITWEVEIEGGLYDDTTTQVDLSQVTVTDLSRLERAMDRLPEAELLVLGLCGVDNPDWGNSRMTGKLAVSRIENEDLAAYRDRVKDRYKVVWTVRLGPNIALRTDKDNFMPNHFGVGILTDEYSYNLRYCIDMVCLDLGHMTVSQIDYVAFMPKLKYLILAWTNVKYIEPIRSCKELLFLELDNSAIRDISPLVDCTSLEDLNIGKTWPDVTPLTQMPWLKNVYMIFGSRGDAWKVTQACPDTHVVVTGNATVGSNWRKLQNYYDMRDMLNMPYMHG